MDTILAYVGRITRDVLPQSFHLPSTWNTSRNNGLLLKTISDLEPWQKAAAGSIAGLVLFKLFVFRRKRINKTAGRRVVVTGAASGIGKLVAKMLASDGWRVFACDVNEKGLDELRAFPNVTPVALDVRNVDACQSLTDLVGADGASLDGLVNIAGVVQTGPVCGFSEEQVRFVFDVNTFGPMRLSRMMIPIMLRTKRGGSIINVTSVGGKVAWPWSGNYSPSKAAVNLFCDCLRRESKANKLPLRVTIVAPGAVETPMLHGFIPSIQAWVAKNPDNHFAPGARREAEFLTGLLARGMDASAIAIDSTTVAKKIVDVLEDPNPGAYYLVATFTFKLIYYAALFLPTSLGDALMLCM